MAVARPKKETRSVQGRKESHTSERILDIAERLVQTRGFNNFSYADIASELGITTASLHYHFPGKAELGQALITRYAERFSQALDQIEQHQPNARASSRHTPASTPTCCAVSECACAESSPPNTRHCPSRCAAK